MISEEIYAFFSDYIKKYTGIEYTEKNYYQLDGRLSELAKRLDIGDVNDLYHAFKMQVTPQMHQNIVDLATNNETSFFRDRRPFDLLAKHILPDLWVRRKSEKKISVWSAGCSAGQEIYSVLMTIREHAPEFFQWTLEVDATDISSEILAKAAKGEYTQLEVQRGLPVNLMMKYLEPSRPGYWQVKEELRSKIKFRSLNLLTDYYGHDSYDIILCRNVLIYQPVENKKLVLEKMGRALKPDGYLILGNGESMIGVSDIFKQHCEDGATFFKFKDEKENKSGTKAS